MNNSSVYLSISKWVENNPTGYLEIPYSEIAKECKCSTGSIDRHLPNIIADRDGILPSEVLQKRVDAGIVTAGRYPPISTETIQQVYNLHDEGNEVRDISYLTGVGFGTIYKILRKRKQ